MGMIRFWIMLLSSSDIQIIRKKMKDVVDPLFKGRKKKQKFSCLNLLNVGNSFVWSVHTLFLRDQSIMGQIPNFQDNLILVYVFCLSQFDNRIYLIFVDLVHTITNTRQTRIVFKLRFNKKHITIKVEKTTKYLKDLK